MATLPDPVNITEGMSIGVYVVVTWPAQPYTGFVISNINEPAGCGEAYWNAPRSRGLWSSPTAIR